jgi:hypothetical protein
LIEEEDIRSSDLGMEEEEESRHLEKINEGLSSASGLSSSSM